MKVGMIFECGPAGPDQQVCEYLARKLIPELKIVSITLTDKKSLLRECGGATAQLLKEGCERVLIIWDHRPPWRTQSACRKEDREVIRQSLESAGIPFGPPVFLVCIEQMLEAWLVADGSAVSAVLSRPTRPARIQDTRRPDNETDPKARLIKVFVQHSGRKYTDVVDAIKIARRLQTWNKITRSPTFCRFALKLSGSVPRGDIP